MLYSYASFVVQFSNTHLLQWYFRRPFPLRKIKFFHYTDNYLSPTFRVVSSDGHTGLSMLLLWLRDHQSEEMLARVMRAGCRALPSSQFHVLAITPSMATMVPMRHMADAPAAPYIVTEAEVPETEAEESQKIRRGWFVMKGIRGHTKKLSPLARQVRHAWLETDASENAYSAH